MTVYFKVLKDDKVISVGDLFLKWSTKQHRYFICDVEQGEAVMSFDEHYYRDNWLRPIPEEAKYEEATIVVIEQQEYEDLLALLKDGEEIPVVEEVPVEPEPEAATLEEEKPMSIAEMRAIILEQQEQIKTLMQKMN